MRRRDKTYSLNTGTKNSFHLLYDFINGHIVRCGFVTIVTYLIILAINTLHIAVVEKNITYPFIPRDNRFFPMMTENRSYRSGCTTLTKSQFGICSIGKTFARTTGAILKSYNIIQLSFSLPKIIIKELAPDDKYFESIIEINYNDDY